MKITTVGQLRKALENFTDEDTIDTIVKDDFATFGLGIEINTNEGPGSDGTRFYNSNGCAIIDMKLTAIDGSYIGNKMLTKVTKRKIK
jgi:hypothetical protein